MSQYAEDSPVDPEEQAIAADPDPEDVEEVAAEPTPRDDADDADLLEQAAPVSGADDDYPNDLEVEPDV